MDTAEYNYICTQMCTLPTNYEAPLPVLQSSQLSVFDGRLMSSLTVEETVSWIRKIGRSNQWGETEIDKYVESFRQNKVTGRKLGRLTMNRLKMDLNVRKVGHRFIILEAIRLYDCKSPSGEKEKYWTAADDVSNMTASFQRKNSPEAAPKELSTSTLKIAKPPTKDMDYTKLTGSRKSQKWCSAPLPCDDAKFDMPPPSRDLIQNFPMLDSPEGSCTPKSSPSSSCASPMLTSLDSRKKLKLVCAPDEIIDLVQLQQHFQKFNYFVKVQPSERNASECVIIFPTIEEAESALENKFLLGLPLERFGFENFIGCNFLANTQTMTFWAKGRVPIRSGWDLKSEVICELMNESLVTVSLIKNDCAQIVQMNNQGSLEELGWAPICSEISDNVLMPLY